MYEEIMFFLELKNKYIVILIVSFNNNVSDNKSNIKSLIFYDWTIMETIFIPEFLNGKRENQNQASIINNWNMVGYY